MVLAAGRSARMGSPKALLDFLGLPFIVRILEALEKTAPKRRTLFWWGFLQNLSL